MPHINTVLGPIPSEDLGRALSHEHILVDWIGADRIAPGRYDPDAVKDTIRPNLMSVRDRGYSAFFDCTPAYLGRDPRLLRDLSRETGLHIVTNTGLYKEPYIPAFALGIPSVSLAEYWIREFEDGIDGLGIKPGFIKIAVHPGPLAPMQERIVEAAAIASKTTGLAVVCHTCDDPSALGALNHAMGAGIDPRRMILAHADGLSGEALEEAYGKGAWLSFDCVGWRPVEDHIRLLRWAKDKGMLGSILLSHDAGWYNVGEPRGGTIKPYVAITDHLLPALLGDGNPDAAEWAGIGDLLLTYNPMKAFSVS